MDKTRTKDRENSTQLLGTSSSDAPLNEKLLCIFVCMYYI